MTNLQTRRQFLKRGLLACSTLAFATPRALGMLVRKPRPPLDADFAVANLALIRRSSWTQTRPDAGKLHAAVAHDRLTVHHAGNRADFTTSEQSVIYELEGILTAHRARRYGDIGYHFIVDYAGRVWEGRSLSYDGAHVAYENEGNIGIMLMGNFEEQQPSSEQVQSLDTLVSMLCDRFQIRRERIYGHRDLGYSVCPGRNLYPHVQEMRT